MVDKQVLRKVYLEKRLFLSPEEYHQRNELLVDRLLREINFTKFSMVHTFLSITEKKEVDTFQIIDMVKVNNPGIGMVISKTMPKGQLTHFVYDNTTKIEANTWGIPEPVGASPASINTIDIVLVPLLSFDRTGHRIGYGKGYYDRFLKQVPNALKVGLSLSPPLDHIPYSDELDVKLDACVTPFKVYNF